MKKKTTRKPSLREMTSFEDGEETYTEPVKKKTKNWKKEFDMIPPIYESHIKFIQELLNQRTREVLEMVSEETLIDNVSYDKILKHFGL